MYTFHLNTLTSINCIYKPYNNFNIQYMCVTPRIVYKNLDFQILYKPSHNRTVHDCHYLALCSNTTTSRHYDVHVCSTKQQHVCIITTTSVATTSARCGLQQHGGPIELPECSVSWTRSPVQIYLTGRSE